MEKRDLLNESGEWYGTEVVCESDEEFRQAWEDEYEAVFERGEKRSVWNQKIIRMSHE